MVDDSPVTRRVLKDLLGADPGLEVVHAAAGGVAALKFLAGNRVDVVTLDVNMPGLSGLETLREVVRLHRLPCVMVSSTTQAGARTTLDALAAGAVDFVAKPDADNPAALLETGEQLREKVRGAAGADLSRLLRERPELVQPRFPHPPRRDLVLIGASTGGPIALETVLGCFPADFPAAFVVAQHMPLGFTGELAARLDAQSRLTVREAEDLSPVEPGLVLVVPGGKHSVLEEEGGRRVVRTRPAAVRTPHLPSIDDLFASAARLAPRRTIACLLTGMGTDGAAGMGLLRRAGAVTLAESERSAVIWGMPKKAIMDGVVDVVVSKEQMAEEITHRMLL